MSPSAVRASAAAVAMLAVLFVAVLAGVATGVTGAGMTCPAGEEAGPCEPDVFAVLPAVAGFFGAAVAGGLAVGVTSALRPQPTARTGRAAPATGPGGTAGVPGTGPDPRASGSTRTAGPDRRASGADPGAYGPDPGAAGLDPRPSGAAPVAGPDALAGRERDALVREMVYLRDRLTSDALSARLGRALADAGVATVSPLGERFDPTRHEAGGSLPAPDHDRIGRIAAVEQPGYTDRAAVLRPPVVTVYR
ncbi:nucleotide exchange factor GrpE [Longispora sp. K20-0274]|uniref:nucleotide exchange factor GrpE n=1 Tax=Longispora sp. K20-0274 TaxID=3088255 RepID=UPI00399BF140